MKCLISISGGGSFVQYAKASGRLASSTLDVVSDRRNTRIGDENVDRFVVRKDNPRYWDEFTELALGYDVIFLNSNWIIPGDTLRRLDGRFVLNQHPSLLPSFKGLDPWQAILDAGVRLSGVTYHLVTPEVDAGPIVCQAAYAVPAGLDVAGLKELHFASCKDVYVDVLSWFEQGAVSLENGRVVVRDSRATGRIVSPSR